MTVLMGRTSRASESNKQLAEMAASNGMNLILAKLNDNRTADISYLWRLNQNQQLNPVGIPVKQWDLDAASIRLLIDQPCSPQNLTATSKKVLLGDELSPNISLRSDGRTDAVRTSYRLRSFSYSPGDNKVTFEIEGYATQGSNEVLARALLTRTVALKRQTNIKDWGVLAAQTMALGPSSIQGDGKVIWLIDPSNVGNIFTSSATCTSSALGKALGSTNSGLQSRIWPLVGLELPPTAILAQNSANDKLPGSSPAQDRNWYISDNTTVCGSGNAVCTRGNTANYTPLTTPSGTLIRISSSSICPGTPTTTPCILKIDNINLTAKTLGIETSSRHVILAMNRRSFITLQDTGKICQVDNGGTACSTSPRAENLIITAINSTNISCTANPNTSSDQQILTFGGNSLPSAIALMPTGSISITSNASMNGLLWANKICATPGINLSTNNNDGSSIINGFLSTWKPDSSFSFGRTITRGIRGTSLDVFRRW